MVKSKLGFFLFLLVLNVVLVSIFQITLSLVQVLKTHAFLAALHFLTSLIQSRFAQTKKPLLTLSLSVNFLRIIGCLVYLSPHILSKKVTSDIYIYNFFLVYFSVLFFDVFLKWKKQTKINA